MHLIISKTNLALCSSLRLSDSEPALATGGKNVEEVREGPGSDKELRSQ